MSKLKFSLALLIVVLAAPAANAGSGCSIFTYNNVPTAGQWNACLSTKQDDLGFAPVNKAGDAMAGRLTTVAPSSFAGFSLTPGASDPISPSDGDLWIKSTGLFARVNGTTVGPFLAPPLSLTSGSSILKGNGSGGFANATSSVDYAPATSGSSILKANGTGGFASAASGTDYAPATSGSSILKGSGAGGFANAVSGTDYAPATSGTSMLLGNGTGGFSAFAGITLTTNQWIQAISASGVATKAQPACGNLSNAATSCSTDTTNAANITSGTLPPARLGGLNVAVNSIASNVAMNNTSLYFDGPTLTQGSTGTWYASGTVTVNSSTADSIVCKIWDGTSTIANGVIQIAAGGTGSISLSGAFGTPPGNIRISCRDTSSANGIINSSADSTAKSSTLTAFRIN